MADDAIQNFLSAYSTVRGLRGQELDREQAMKDREAQAKQLKRKNLLDEGDLRAKGQEIYSDPLTGEEKVRSIPGFIKPESKIDTIKNQIDLLRLQGLQTDAKEKAKGKTLPAGQAQALGEASAANQAIEDIRGLVKENEDIMGPGQGLLSKAAGFFQIGERGKRSAALEAALNQRAQTLGKSLEGGKLTDEDIKRYRQLLPKTTDTPQVAQSKADALARQLSQKQRSEKDTLARAGYNTSEIEDLSVPEFANMKSQGLINQQGLMSQPPALKKMPVSQEDKAAIDWAKKNPRDPRSAQILQLHGA